MVKDNKGRGIALIASNIDGSLSRGPRSSLDLGRLARLQQYNINAISVGAPPLVLCTGRSTAYAQAFCQALAVHQPCVCENGAIIYNPVEACIRPRLETSHGAMRALSELRMKYDDGRCGRFAVTLDSGYEICLSLRPKTSSPVTPAILDELMEAVRLEADMGHLTVTRSMVAVLICPVGADKGAGLMDLAQTKGISREHILAIGSSPADLSALCLVGYPAVPQNADPSLKNVACYTSEKVHVAGVLDICEALLEPRH